MINNSDSNRNRYSFKRLLLVVVMLLMGHAGFSAEATFFIFPPLDDDGSISHFCLEYREAATPENFWTAGEWITIEIFYDKYTIEEHGYMSCVLDGLSANTYYDVRVHACYFNGGEFLWGIYGTSYLLYINELGSDVLNIPIRSGRINAPYGEPLHPDLEWEMMYLLPCTGVLYRRREEEEMDD